MIKKILIAFVILTTAGALFILKTIYDAGEFKDLSPHSNLQCKKFEGIPGAEDIVIDRKSGIAYISSDDRRKSMAGNPVQGAIFAYSLNAGNSIPKKLTDNLPFDFHPHGIDLYSGPDGSRFLFVINHRKDDHYVERFEIKGNRLIHIESIKGKLMTSPNDIAAAGPKEFYLTNDHGNTTKFGRMLEDYLRLSRANVIYFNGKEFVMAADDFTLANGIAVHEKENLLFVSSTTGGYMKVFERNRKNGALKHVTTIDLETAGDNIDIAQDGKIWIACHPKLLTFVKHSKDEKVDSPSQIIVFSRAGDASFTRKEIYLNTGEEISAASVAATKDRRVLVGSVFENHILDCRLKE
jgi:arylesterase/paraoxonase